MLASAEGAELLNPAYGEGWVAAILKVMAVLAESCHADFLVRRLLEGTSLVVQWLGLCASAAGHMSLILGQGTKIPMPWGGPKNK